MLLPLLLSRLIIVLRRLTLSKYSYYYDSHSYSSTPSIPTTPTPSSTPTASLLPFLLAGLLDPYVELRFLAALQKSFVFRLFYAFRIMRARTLDSRALMRGKLQSKDNFFND